MTYTKDDPEWVQAEKIIAESPSLEYFQVTAYGETFKNCRVGWHHSDFNNSKSVVLVQNSRGDWLKVWFFDKDVEQAP